MADVQMTAVYAGGLCMARCSAWLGASYAWPGAIHGQVLCMATATGVHLTTVGLGCAGKYRNVPQFERLQAELRPFYEALHVL
jgi:predicted GNAT superfamily acetyltransferase